MINLFMAYAWSSPDAYCLSAPIRRLGAFKKHDANWIFTLPTCVRRLKTDCYYGLPSPYRKKWTNLRICESQEKTDNLFEFWTIQLSGLKHCHLHENFKQKGRLT